ncbi:MAG: SBBP repeat-containing protein, partial [Melioribacteraceae bacterium]|nr:SBBP repeat-containing protein [Melioribacteraceae bacterium]
MDFYGNEDGKLEFDFIVNPGIDPEQIEIQFNEIDSSYIDKNGNLSLSIDQNELIFEKPIIYQYINHSKEEITGEYLADNTGNVKFSLGKYDPQYALVIDPVISYASYFGGGGHERIGGIALDKDNNIYITGQTNSADFPTTRPEIGPAENDDMFVTKIAPDGQSILYSTVIGGKYGEFGYDIKVDGKGNAYVCGWSSSYDDLNTTEVNEGFPILNGFRDFLVDNYSSDAIAIKLNDDGSLAYSTYFGAPDEDEATALDIDSTGCMYIIGTTLSSIGYPGFPIRNAFQPDRGGYDYEGFVTKIDPTKVGDASLIYSSFLGGTGDDVLNGITVDKDGHAIVVGRVWGVNFPLVNAMYSTKKGDYDAFVTKVSPFGNELIFSTFIGGDGTDTGYLVDTDENSSIYVTASVSENFPRTEGTIGSDCTLGQVIFKMSPTGQTLEYSSFLCPIYASAFRIDSDGSLFLLISEWKQKSDGTFGSVYSTAKLNTTATEITQKSEIVGTIFPQVSTLDESGNVYFGISTREADLELVNPIQDVLKGWSDLYIGWTKPGEKLLIYDQVVTPAEL